MQRDRETRQAQPERLLGAARRTGCLLLTIGLLAASAPRPAAADDYDDQSSGHPLRIIAYVLHPFGVAIDYLLLRPAHWLGTQEPLKTIFGHED
jgi:hypothetical protein